MTRAFRFGVGFSALGVGDRAWIDRVRRLEDQGYSTVSVADHPALGTDGPFSALGAIAMVTTTVRIGTRVLANDFRHPLLVAREMATLDQLSGGRVELGLGAGWLRTDYATAGACYDRASVR